MVDVGANTMMLIVLFMCIAFFFFSSRRRHTRCSRDWSSDVCSSDLSLKVRAQIGPVMSKITGQTLLFNCTCGPPSVWPVIFVLTGQVGTNSSGFTIVFSVSSSPAGLSATGRHAEDDEG